MNVDRIAIVSTLLLFSLITFRCAPSDEERIQDVKHLVAEHKLEKARTTIETELAERMESASETLSGSSRSPFPTVSFDRSLFAWLDEDLLFFYRDANHRGSIDLPEAYEQLHLSSNGNRAVLVQTTEETCHFLIVTLTEEPLFDRFETERCDGDATVLDRDGTVFFSRDGKLYRYTPTLQTDPPPPRDVSIEKMAKLFSANYSKVENGARLVDADEKNVLVLYGAAGSYRLYRLEPDTQKTHLLTSTIASPEIRPALATDPLQFCVEPTDPQRKERRFWLYGGTAGQYTVELFRTDGSIRREKGSSTTVLQNPIYLPSGSLFFATDTDSRIGCFQKNGERVKLYPVPVQRQTAVNAGYLYTDRSGELKLRTTPLSPFEKKLSELYPVP